MKKWKVSFLFLFCCTVLFCQKEHQQIDSLIKKAIAFNPKNQDSALYYSKQAYELARHTQDTILKASSSYHYSYCLIIQDKVEKALSVLQFNLDNEGKIPEDLLGKSYYNIGSAYYLKENYDKAIEYYLQTIMPFEQSKNRKGLAKTYLQLNVIYTKLGKEELSDYFASASLANSESASKYHQKESVGSVTPPEERVKVSQLMLNEIKEGTNDKLKAILYYSIGFNQMLAQQWRQAIESFTSSLKIKEAIGYLNNIDKTHLYLGECYHNLRDSENALKNLWLAKELSGKRKQLLKIEGMLSEVYAKNGNYKKALIHSNNFKRLTDSVNQLLENDRIAKITAQFETEKQGKQIEALQLENNKTSDQLTRQKTQWWLWAAFAIALLLSTLWMAKRWTESRKITQQIREEKKSIERKVEIQHLLLNNKTKVYLDELHFVKSEGNYVEFHLVERKTLDRNKLKSILSQLPPNFVRVHRSYIVNKNEIASFTSSIIFLKSGHKIPLSRTFKSNIA